MWEENNFKYVLKKYKLGGAPTTSLVSSTTNSSQWGWSCFFSQSPKEVLCRILACSEPGGEAARRLLALPGSLAPGGLSSGTEYNGENSDGRERLSLLADFPHSSLYASVHKGELDAQPCDAQPCPSNVCMSTQQHRKCRCLAGLLLLVASGGLFLSTWVWPQWELCGPAAALLCPFTDKPLSFHVLDIFWD